MSNDNLTLESLAEMIAGLQSEIESLKSENEKLKKPLTDREKNIRARQMQFDEMRRLAQIGRALHRQVDPESIEGKNIATLNKPSIEELCAMDMHGIEPCPEDDS
ncbi:MAG: hypothetical protein CML56_00880 [Rhodobacteraceae bacterium]|nr:hypothetical protein [Paracoccaceae bacterium]